MSEIATMSDFVNGQLYLFNGESGSYPAYQCVRLSDFSYYEPEITKYVLTLCVDIAGTAYIAGRTLNSLLASPSNPASIYPYYGGTPSTSAAVQNFYSILKSNNSGFIFGIDWECRQYDSYTSKCSVFADASAAQTAGSNVLQWNGVKKTRYGAYNAAYAGASSYTLQIATIYGAYQMPHDNSSASYCRIYSGVTSSTTSNAGSLGVYGKYMKMAQQSTKVPEYMQHYATMMIGTSINSSSYNQFFFGFQYDPSSDKVVTAVDSQLTTVETVMNNRTVALDGTCTIEMHVVINNPVFFWMS